MAGTDSKAACAKCKKDIAEISQCDRCGVKYCSSSCKNLHWKKHKKECARPQCSEPTPSSSGPSGLPRGLKKPVDGMKAWKLLERGTWFHKRPETDVYKLLIDAYRLRMDDRWEIAKVQEPGSLYVPGATDGKEGFGIFLDKAEKVKEKGVPLLPTWWNEAKRKECEALGADAMQWSSLAKKVRKTDIQRHYDDMALPMQLRSIGETVYNLLVDGKQVVDIPDYIFGGPGMDPDIGHDAVRDDYSDSD